MNRLVAAVALLLVTPGWAPAQSEERPYRGQGYVAFGLGGASGHPRSAGAVEQISFGGEGFLYKGLGLGAGVGYVNWGQGQFNDQAWMPSADVSYHFGRRARRGGIDPYVLGGFTAYVPTSHGNRGAPAGNIGGGVNVWIREHAALRFEVRNTISNSDFGPGDEYVSFRFGLTFR